jgi:hypothetical protein
MQKGWTFPLLESWEVEVFILQSLLLNAMTLQQLADQPSIGTYPILTQIQTMFVQYKPGLWIRIDFIQIRVRIQHFCSIRIRIGIQAKTELSRTISFSNFFEIKI